MTMPRVVLLSMEFFMEFYGILSALPYLTLLLGQAFFPDSGLVQLVLTSNYRIGPRVLPVGSPPL